MTELFPFPRGYVDLEVTILSPHVSAQSQNVNVNKPLLLRRISWEDIPHKSQLWMVSFWSLKIWSDSPLIRPFSLRLTVSHSPIVPWCSLSRLRLMDSFVALLRSAKAASHVPSYESCVIASLLERTSLQTS